MRIASVRGLTFLLLLVACDHSEREKADHAAKEARAETRELGHEVKKQSQAVASQVRSNGTSEAQEKLDRAALIARIKAQLFNDLGVASVANISVAVNEDSVMLTGHVASEDQKKTAERAARRVPGVERVHDELEVRP